MTTREFTSPTGFLVSVTVTSPPAPQLTFLERVVMRLGGPELVVRLCNGFNVVCCLISAVWILLWTIWLHGIIARTFHPTVGESFFFSTAWLPLMLIQILTGALRYAVLTLQLKAARQVSDASTLAFFEGVNTVVAHAVQSYMAERPEPEKPTLQ